VLNVRCGLRLRKGAINKLFLSVYSGIVLNAQEQEKGGIDWLARAINEKILRLSKLSKPGSPGTTVGRGSIMTKMDFSVM
jgi:hypothetical protein